MSFKIEHLGMIIGDERMHAGNSNVFTTGSYARQRHLITGREVYIPCSAIRRLESEQ
jgi:hypothetical protein